MTEQSPKTAGWTLIGHTPIKEALYEASTTHTFQPGGHYAGSDPAGWSKVFIAQSSATMVVVADDQPTLPWPSTDDREENADVLDGAADLLAARGWCQRVAWDVDGRMCAVGSIDASAIINARAACSPTTSRCEAGCFTARHHARFTAAHSLFRRYLAEAEASVARGPFGLEITEWNDAKDRTAEDVINALRKCAIWVREQVGP